MPVTRGFIVWLVIIFEESIRGTLRKLLLEPHADGVRARQIGLVVGCCVILAIARAFIRWIDARSRAQLVVTGLLWVALTVSFEITLGRLMLNFPWDRITADCDPRRGGLMVLGLLFMSVCPLIAARWRSS